MTNNFKSLAPLLLIGFVLFVLINNIENILTQLCQLLALYTISTSKFFDLYRVLPRLIIVGFWALLIFRYLKYFTGNINLKSDFSKKLLIKLGIITFSLYFVQYGLNFLVTHIWSLKSEEFAYNHSMISNATIITSILGLIEITIIAVGYFKIVKATTTTTNNGYSK